MNYLQLTKLIPISCCECGVIFGMPADMNREREEDQGTFYCLNGHKQHYCDETEAQRLQKENAVLGSRNAHLEDQLDSTQKSRNAFKGHLNRTKKRIANGVCPCCNRTFKDLARHMSSQHPHYSEASRDD